MFFERAKKVSAAFRSIRAELRSKPERSAPLRTAPRKSAPPASAPRSRAPDRFAPRKIANSRSANLRLLLERLAPVKLADLNTARIRPIDWFFSSAPQLAPVKSASRKLAPDRFPTIRAPDRSARSRLAP